MLANPLILKQILWCRGTESNCRHGDFQSPALPTELPRRIKIELILLLEALFFVKIYFAPYLQKYTATKPMLQGLRFGLSRYGVQVRR